MLGTGERHAVGLARTVEHLAIYLDPAKWHLSVILLREDGPVGDRLRGLGVDVSAVNWSEGARDVFGARRLIRELRRRSPDIVHFHAGGRAQRFVAKVATRARIVAHFHSIYEETGQRVHRTTAGAHAVIANSRATAATLGGAAATVVHQGVPVAPRTRSHESDCIKLGVAARLAPVKDISSLLSAMALLRQDPGGITLEIVGEGPSEAALRRESASLGLDDSIDFLGWTDDVGERMRRWDIYVQPSIAEGFGLSVLEAMAAGLPVVAAKSGGMPEVVIDGETGILVPPGDPKALAGAIAKLARDRDLRLALGKAGRERAMREFAIAYEVRAIESIYQKLLA